jgi:hypothetical protein
MSPSDGAFCRAVGDLGSLDRPGSWGGSRAGGSSVVERWSVDGWCDGFAALDPGRFHGGDELAALLLELFDGGQAVDDVGEHQPAQFGGRAGLEHLAGVFGPVVAAQFGLAGVVDGPGDRRPLFGVAAASFDCAFGRSGFGDDQVVAGG